MIDATIAISIDIKNQKELEDIFNKIQKNYSINLSLPISQIASQNTALSTLNALFTTLAANLSHMPQLDISPQINQITSYSDQLRELGSILSDPISIPSLIDAYNQEMAHLSQLRALGLITYDEIIQKSWEYYRALKDIALADGDVSDAEQQILNLFLARARRAQLQLNQEGSDLTTYYNSVRFLDESYYEWKKQRIQDNVSQMDISDEQKKSLIASQIESLDLERNEFLNSSTLSNKFLQVLSPSLADQKKISDSFSSIASQISSIWSQLYSNLDAARQKSLEKLERRAKEERRSEAWLASEKDKINSEYDKKARQMKRAEKSMQIASALMNTAEGVTNALTLKPAWLAPIMAAAVGSLGLYQVKLIADQKLAGGGVVNHGLFRGKGTSTSDSNLIAISDSEYIVSARRVRELGLPLLDALNFGDGETVRKALASFNYNLNHSALIQAPAAPNRSGAYSGGGAVNPPKSASQPIKVVLVCDGRELARAVSKGNKRIIST